MIIIFVLFIVSYPLLHVLWCKHPAYQPLTFRKKMRYLNVWIERWWNRLLWGAIFMDPLTLNVLYCLPNLTSFMVEDLSLNETCERVLQGVMLLMRRRLPDYTLEHIIHEGMVASIVQTLPRLRGLHWLPLCLQCRHLEHNFSGVWAAYMIYKYTIDI